MTAGTYGDVHPFIVLSRALQERGHQVCLAAEHRHEEMVRGAGLEFRGLMKASRTPPAPPGNLVAAFQRYWLVEGFAGWFRRKSWLLGLVEPAYKLVEDRLSAGNSIVVAKATIFGARLAHEKLGVPLVTVHLSTGTIRSEYDAPGLPLPNARTIPQRWVKRGAWALIDRYVKLVVEPGVNRIRSRLQLPPLRRPLMRWMNSPDLVLGLFPDWFGDPQPDWPCNFHAIGFPLVGHAGEGDPTLSDDLAAFLEAGEPPVVFTLGSSVRYIRRFFRVSVDACVLSGRRALLQTPRADDVPSDLPDTVRHVTYMPYRSVFPKVAAVVHNGGIGTTALALAAGVPQIIMPIAEDHRENGARVRRLNAGRVIRSSAYNVATLNAQLGELLQSDAVAETCRGFRDRVRQAEPMNEACVLIEEFARKRHAVAEEGCHRKDGIH
jgi:UDP:flavonoid glycosyltransferase YjiC (YdhE family)